MRPNREETMTPEDIAKHYSSSMDSVNLINEMLTITTTLTDQEKRRLKANSDHLKIMLGKTFWLLENDLTVFTAASVAADAKLAV